MGFTGGSGRGAQGGFGPFSSFISALAQDPEAHSAASSALSESPMLILSSSEEVDVLSNEAGDFEDSPPLSPAYEELLEVVTRAIAKLNIKWTAEKQKAQKTSKLDKHIPLCRGLSFFPNLHAEVSRLWKRLFSSRNSSAAVTNYLSILGSKENSYGMMPWVEETLALP